MKLITYNIWNHNTNFNKRMDALAELLAAEHADCIALQEVRSKEVVKRIANTCGFQHYVWKEYHDCEEGLAILSRHEINSVWTNWDESTDVHNSGLMCAEIDVDGLIISVMNVHLDYKDAINREIEVVKAAEYIHRTDAQYKIMLGDFNTYPTSSIYGYLTGRQSLRNSSARWIDLGMAYAVRNNQSMAPTIDFYNNPRWAQEPILDVPGRFDWVLLENPYPRDYPTLQAYRLIGTEPVDGTTPSDHFGIVCELFIQASEE